MLCVRESLLMNSTREPCAIETTFGLTPAEVMVIVLVATGGSDGEGDVELEELPHAAANNTTAATLHDRAKPGALTSCHLSALARTRSHDRPRRERGLGGNARRSFQRPRHGTETEAPSVPQSRRAWHHLAPSGAWPVRTGISPVNEQG